MWRRGLKECTSRILDLWSHKSQEGLPGNQIKCRVRAWGPQKKFKTAIELKAIQHWGPSEEGSVEADCTLQVKGRDRESIHHVLKHSSLVIFFVVVVVGFFSSPQNPQGPILVNPAPDLYVKVIQQHTRSSVSQICVSLQDLVGEAMVLAFLSDFLEFLLLHNKLPQTEQLKTRHISYFTSSMG